MFKFSIFKIVDFEFKLSKQFKLPYSKKLSHENVRIPFAGGWSDVIDRPAQIQYVI